jgi:hypothetical protein
VRLNGGVRWVVFGILLAGSGVWCSLLLKALVVHTLDHMNAVRWRSEALPGFAWTVLLLIIPVLGHGWAGAQWARRHYAAMCLAVLLAYAVPITLFSIAGDVHAAAAKRNQAAHAAGRETGR